MSETISTKNVKRFDGSNFQGWKFQIKALLVANEIQDVVDGTRQRPVNRETAESKEWVRDNAKAMFLISSSIEYAQLECLLTCATAKEMWSKLSDIHEQKTVTNKIGLLQKFYEYRMSTEDTIVQHCAKVINLAGQIRDVGEEMSEATIMAKILTSLSSKYSVLQTAWESVDPTRQTLSYLQERLIREEARLGTEDEGTSASAFTTIKREPLKNKKEKSKRNIECYKCHALEHYARECKKRGKNNRNNDQSRDCVFVMSSERASKTVRNIRSGLTSTKIQELMTVEQSEVWITDSGASRHATYRRE